MGLVFTARSPAFSQLALPIFPAFFTYAHRRSQGGS